MRSAGGVISLAGIVVTLVGCGSDRGAAPIPCDLVTSEEVSAIVGTTVTWADTVASDAGGSRGCNFVVSGVTLLQVWLDEDSRIYDVVKAQGSPVPSTANPTYEAAVSGALREAVSTHAGKYLSVQTTAAAGVAGRIADLAVGRL